MFVVHAAVGGWWLFFVNFVSSGHRHAVCLHSWLYLSQFETFYIFQRIWNRRKSLWRRGKGSSSFPILSHICPSFPNLGLINFLNGRTKRNGVRAQFAKVFMNVRDFVRFSMFRPKMSSSVPRWPILVETAYTKKHEAFSEPSRVSS